MVPWLDSLAVFPWFTQNTAEIIPIIIGKSLLNRISSYLTAKIVPVSYGCRGRLLGRLRKFPPSKIRTILNGIDTSLFYRNNGKRKKMEELGISQSVPVVGIVARLSPEKDHATLLEACKILSQNQIEFRLVVVGDGPLRKALEATSRQPELAGRVVFTGMRRDIADLLAEMDLFVLTSTTEGLSLTLLEAMASSLPVVATRVGGNAEVVFGRGRLDSSCPRGIRRN